MSGMYETEYNVNLAGRGSEGLEAGQALDLRLWRRPCHRLAYNSVGSSYTYMYVYVREGYPYYAGGPRPNGGNRGGYNYQQHTEYQGTEHTVLDLTALQPRTEAS